MVPAIHVEFKCTHSLALRHLLIRGLTVIILLFVILKKDTVFNNIL